MLSRRIPAVLVGVLLGSLLAVPLTPSPAHAGTRVSPALTTGDWFDTTYDLVVFR
jgi:hypothetical protein